MKRLNDSSDAPESRQKHVQAQRKRKGCILLKSIRILAPESTTNSISSGSSVDAAVSTHSSAGK